MDINWIIGKRFSRGGYDPWMNMHRTGEVMSIGDDFSIMIKYDKDHGYIHKEKELISFLGCLLVDKYELSKWFVLYMQDRMTGLEDRFSKLREDGIVVGSVVLVWNGSKNNAKLGVVDDITLFGDVISQGKEYENAQLVVSKEEADKLKQ